MQIPEGQQESQLMLWLKSLSAFTKRNVKQRIFNDSVWGLLQSNRLKFIKHLKDTYKKASIYNPDVFFGVLHDLTDPELYPLACEWLRGDDLSEESMQALKVKHSIEQEDAAKNILANFGRISTETQPIVLCFDNLDNIPRLPDGYQDFQALFNVNTTIHNDYIKNFLIVISIITNTWKQNSDRIQQADKAGIHQVFQLKRITLDQAEALWAYRLYPIHRQANPKPNSPIFPLERQFLEQKFPGGKTAPRNVLMLGQDEYQKYRGRTTPIIRPIKPPVDIIQSEFQLIWQHEYNKVQKRITKVNLLAAPELIRMLQEAIAALQVQGIKPKLLSGKFTSYSLSYQQLGQKERIGVVWTEDSSMNSFVHVMNACQKVINSNLCKTLYLIRAAGVGNPKLAGNQIYRQIFTGTHHRHIKPTLSHVHYLATYHSLVNAALASELVVAGKILSLKELEDLIRKSEILNKCTLLQDLGIVSSKPDGGDNGNGEGKLQDIKEFLLNLVKTQGYLAKKVLIQNTLSQFSQVTQSQVEVLIQELCQAKKIQIIDPNVPPEAQLIYFVPQG
jgi:hypothetical protein